MEEVIWRLILYIKEIDVDYKLCILTGNELIDKERSKAIVL